MNAKFFFIRKQLILPLTVTVKSSMLENSVSPFRLTIRTYLPMGLVIAKLLGVYAWTLKPS